MANIPQSAIRNPQSRKIKVLHLITDLDVGGAEMFLFKLLSVINGDFFDNQVVSMTDIGIIGKKIEKLGFSVKSLGMRKGFPSIRGFRILSGILNQEKPDIIQTWMYHADLLGTIVGKRQGMSKIVWNIQCSNIDFSKYRPLTYWVVKLCTWFSSWPVSVIINSTKGYHYHLNLGYHPKRWDLIPSGFDLKNFNVDHPARKDFRKELGLEETDLLVGLVGRFDPMKDHETFLSAACQLAKTNRGVCFLLVGAGIGPENPFFKPYLDKAFLADRLFLLGFRDDMARITASFDLATSSSYGEGFSNTIGEAMACGVPCVVTDVGDSAYIVGDTGLVVPPKNPEALAAAWGTILDLPFDQRIALGLKARQRMEENFDLRVIARKYEKVYQDLIGM